MRAVQTQPDSGVFKWCEETQSSGKMTPEGSLLCYSGRWGRGGAREEGKKGDKKMGRKESKAERKQQR